MKTVMKTILILPLDIEGATIQELRDAGYLPILTDKPEAVRLPAVDLAMPSGDVILSAFKAISGPTSSAERKVFIDELLRRLLANEAKQPQPAPTT